MKINNVNFTGAPRGMKKASTAVALAAASMLPMACADGAGKLVSSEPVRDTVATVVKDTVRKNVDSAKDFFANLYFVSKNQGAYSYNFSSNKQEQTIGVFSTVKSIAARALGSDTATSEKYYLNNPSTNLFTNFKKELASGNTTMVDTTSDDARKFLGQVVDKTLYGKQIAGNTEQEACIKFTKLTDSALVELNKSLPEKDKFTFVVAPRDSVSADYMSRIGNGSQEERIIMTKCVE